MHVAKAAAGIAGEPGDEDRRVMTCPDINPEVWRPIALILGAT